MKARTDIETTITIEDLKAVLDYDPATGAFRWVVARPYGKLGPKFNVGEIAGFVHKVHGYRSLKIKGHYVQAHRVAWFWVHGQWPKHKIDHKNTQRDDNRIANLREADDLGNARNRRIARNNTTGFKGVSIDRQIKGGREYVYYIAQIQTGRGNIRLGYFKTAEAAHAAYCAAAEKIHGEFANFG